MFAEERQRWILRQVQEQGRCRVEELALHLRRSTVTIRHDLRVLEGQGLLRRTRGGAEPPLPGAPQAVDAEAEERRIARLAAALVRDGDALLLGCDPACRALARELREQGLRLTVVTSGVDVATLLEDAPRITTVVTGGTLHPQLRALLGPYAAEALSRLRVDLAFVGAAGVDALAGATAAGEPEAALQALQLRAARRRVLLAGAGKLGRVAPARFARLGELDLLITGRAARFDQVAPLRARGLELSFA